MTVPITRPPGNIDCCLSWAIKVVQLRSLESTEESLLRFERQCFTTTNNASQARAAFEVFFKQKLLQHRRHEMQSRYCVLPDYVDEIVAITMSTWFSNHQPCSNLKRPEKFPNRNVKTEWRFL